MSSRPHFAWKHSLYDRNGHALARAYAFHTNVVLCFNVSFFLFFFLFPKQWLNDAKLAQRLIELIHPERDDEVGHCSILIKNNRSLRTQLSNRTHKKKNSVVHVCPFHSQRQSNASQTLCDIIRLSRDQANQLQEMSQPDPLLTVLES